MTSTKYMIMREDGLIFSELMNDFVDPDLAKKHDDLFKIYYATEAEAKEAMDINVRWGRINPDVVIISKVILNQINE